MAMQQDYPELLNELSWDKDGLIPAVAQDHKDGRILMLAWMSREALAKSIETQEAYYWSRSRQCLWHKGETSGCVQKIKDLFIDCDNDTLVVVVEQTGSGACHTGKYSCFFRKFDRGEWRDSDIPAYSAKE